MTTSYILVKYLHILSILAMVSCLFAEAILVKSSMTRKQIRQVSRLDAGYGIAALLVVGAGLTLWFGVGKGAEFYKNPMLHLKVTLVILAGLLSIIPTIFYLKQRKGDPVEVVHVPVRIRTLIVVQLLLLALVPPLAIMTAYGIH